MLRLPSVPSVLFAVLLVVLTGYPIFAAPADSAVTVVAQASEAAETPRNEPGKFDYYLLALSWSPSFCEVSRQRYAHRRPDPQCGPRPYSFVVHGLWPQYSRGYPENCQVPSPRIPRSLVDSMLDLMPSPRLVFHEWDSHGTCSGLPAWEYFRTVRKAREAIKIPAQYQSIDRTITVEPDQVAEAFVAANPGLKRDAIDVVCDGKRLTGVRICMGKDLAFHACTGTSRSFCRSKSVVMPPVRAPKASLQ
ncbi:MAG: Ribonuclease T2 family protein [Pseudolabrys sp.]|jgi:ribonuclease T2|nr:Ribonuclease T2 family protein [Pseudolabrys sp.]